MKSFKQYITESFEKPYKWTLKDLKEYLKSKTNESVAPNHYPDGTPVPPGYRYDPEKQQSYPYQKWYSPPWYSPLNPNLELEFPSFPPPTKKKEPWYPTLDPDDPNYIPPDYNQFPWWKHPEDLHL